MIELARRKKQYVIMTVFAFIACALLYLAYLVIMPSPTCSDGKKNQDEVGVDCGGICKKCPEPLKTKSLEVLETAHIVNPDGTHDMMFKVSNPNDVYGVSSFEYEFYAENASNETRVLKSGESFILPKETKFIVELAIPAPDGLTDFAVRLIQPEESRWVSFTEFEAPKFSVLNKKYEIQSTGSGFSKVTALIRNDSQFDFGQLWISVILRDAGGKAVALQKTFFKTVRSGEMRDFTLSFPEAFQGDVVGVDVGVESNVFDNENFIRRYLPGGRFQDIGGSR